MINKCMYKINVELSILLIRDFYPAPFCIFLLRGNAISYILVQLLTFLKEIWYTVWCLWLQYIMHRRKNRENSQCPSYYLS